ncbi:MAG: type II toxin-antitoxin system PemK/MazF family toxin [Sarcina sp.]
MINKMVKRGDIFWYNFGTGKGSEQGGLRPVVIVSNDTGNKFSPTVIVAVITSQSKNGLPTHVSINEYSEIGLKAPSKILTEQQRTIDKKFLGDYIGRIAEGTTKELNKALAVNVGIKSVKPKYIEIIEKKIKNINFKEMVVFNMKANNCTNDEYYKMLNREIKEDLKELEYTCRQRNVDINRYYKSYESIREGKKNIA